jgi:hypothetical protein
MGPPDVASRAGNALSAELYDRADSIATDVLHRNRFALASLSDEERARVEAIVRMVATRLVQEPRARLETLDGDAITAARIEALRELFDTSATEVRKQRENKRAV